MSRIGKRPIKIEEGIKVDITPSKVVATCGANSLQLPLTPLVTVKQDGDNLIVERKGDSKESRSQHGLISRLLSNTLKGVKDGFTREMTFLGTGYRAAVNGAELVLSMGYSHDIKIAIPEDLSVTVKKNEIIVGGKNKEEVGQLAAKIREVRPPEVYKGKGIKYKEEKIKRKAGKKAASS